MIKTISMLLDELNTYRDPFGKISRLCKDEELYQLTRGIYTTDKNVTGAVFAPVIYGPSYLSFDYALAYHGFIPEAVHTYTSATCLKGKKKSYTNYFGDYTYRDVPNQVFSLEVKFCYEQSYIYVIATGEKALCDKLYTQLPVKNMQELEEMLFNDLRIDKEVFEKLDWNCMLDLAPLYNNTNLKLLVKLLKRYRRRTQ